MNRHSSIQEEPDIHRIQQNVFEKYVPLDIQFPATRCEGSHVRHEPIRPGSASGWQDLLFLDNLLGTPLRRMSIRPVEDVQQRVR
jgi:hypothetical protein